MATVRARRAAIGFRLLTRAAISPRNRFEDDAQKIIRSSVGFFGKRCFAELAAASSIARDRGAGVLPKESVDLSGLARKTLDESGTFATNERAWQPVLDEIMRKLMDGRQMKWLAQDLDVTLDLVQVLAEKARVTNSEFWNEFTRALMTEFENMGPESRISDKMMIAFLPKLLNSYAMIGAWEPKLFEFTALKLSIEVHVISTDELVKLADIFSRAGAGSQEISRTATSFFNEVEERILNDFGEQAIDFKTECAIDKAGYNDKNCLKLLISMARFGVYKRAVLQTIGRHVLHPMIEKLFGERAAEICYCYGEIGYRHDTVFKKVVEELINENVLLQNARVLGKELPQLKFTIEDSALVALAMLRLKMHRGDTTFCPWGKRYTEVLINLEKRLETEIPNMNARSLSAASFVLGRARQGSVDLYQAMFKRMMELLENWQDVPPAGINSQDGLAKREHEPPQDYLEQFLHGLVMMGPNRQKKDLDAEWFMQWLCENGFKFVLADLLKINRHLVMMRIHDKDYLKAWIPYLEDLMDKLTKEDVQEITHTYNGARLYEDEIGRHFFWLLGRQYQERTKEQYGPRKRPQLTRIG